MSGQALAVRDSEMAAQRLSRLAVRTPLLETGGAVALAALLTGKFDAGGKAVAAVHSGGTIDPAQFAGIIGNGDL